MVFTHLEQVDAVNRAVDSLNRAEQAQAHDVLASDIRQALRVLCFFIGDTPVEDILGRVFSQFCIGK